MPTVLIANPKGGSGKTTLSTNLAGYLSRRGFHVSLSDMDRQKSSLKWLARRPQELPVIHGLNAKAKLKEANQECWNVIDSQAGLHGDKLSEAVKTADWVIVPMQSSVFDIGATEDFLSILREEKAVRKEKTFVAMVGMRIDSRTKAAIQLQDYLAESGFPVMAHIRSAQVYVQAAEQGLSIFDMRSSLVSKDLQQWANLLHWLVNADRNQ